MTANRLVRVRGSTLATLWALWRKAGEAGLRWRSVTSLEGTIDPRNAHLKKYLSEKVAR